MGAFDGQTSLAQDVYNVLPQGAQYAISQAGYKLGLGGAGLSEGQNVPYNANRTPSQVFNTAGTPSQYSGTNAQTINQGSNAYQILPGSQGTNLNQYQQNIGPANPAPTGGGGGGGGGGSPQSSGTINPQTTYLTVNGETKKLADWMSQGVLDANGNPINKGGGGPSQVDVNAAYAPAFQAYQDLFNQANANKPAYMDSIASNFAPQYTGAQNALQQGQQLGQTQMSQNQTQAQSAIDAAKSLFGEVSQGVKQRFGGTNSAGEFANQFYNRELQKQMGGVQNTLGQNQQTVQTKMTQLQDQYTSAVKQIDEGKTAALNQAEQAFQQRLQDIQGMKGQLETQKAASKISELQNYRSLVSQIQQQAQQNALAVQQQAAQAAAQLANTGAMSALYGNAANPATLGQYAQAAYSAMGVPIGGQNQSMNTLSGYYNPYQKIQGQQ